MLARAVTHALVGLEPQRVEVEAHLERGVPAFAIVGLADRACAEAKHRVRSGVSSALLEWPADRRIRPSADRTRQALFDLLAHGPYGTDAGPAPKGQAVLDAFAGTGALAFEALLLGVLDLLSRPTAG